MEADARGARRRAGDLRSSDAAGDRRSPAIRGRDRVPPPDVRLRRRRRCCATCRSRIPAGTTTAIVGATGSGKSTLLSLLPRLHEPPPGTVFVDGVDVRHIPLAVLRGAIGFVPQEPFLFSATIAENIAFGARGEQRTSATAVEQAAAVARLDKDIADVPAAATRRMVGERGITLSGGQKQRTAIARALVIDPRDPGPRRRAVGGRHLHRGGDPAAAARRDAPAHVDHRLAPRVDGARRRSDPRARRRPHRRARHARRAGARATASTPSSYRKQLLEEELAAS